MLSKLGFVISGSCVGFSYFYSSLELLSARRFRHWSWVSDSDKQKAQFL